ncbi:MAG TPA: GNAT family N-acetyltransferase [Prolixibacteraceae bacterium]|jgi:predicted N-acetyltransferase YhbS|nr:GNAT family N-acetyltransferase [Prolixibacteraceae bacterium]
MNQILHIRKETPDDYPWIIELTERAFKTMPFSNGKEGALVEKLRKASTFIERLSLVAELNGQVVGHILFTPMSIENGQIQCESLTLAPVSVLPEFQNRGIGSKLILAGHQRAKGLGFNSVIVFGHPGYYPRFGYKPASFWGIKSPVPLPSEDVFMALELTPGKLSGVTGTVVLPPEFI